MARHFTAAGSNKIDVLPGNGNIDANDITYAVVCTRGSTTWEGLISLETSGNVSQHSIEIESTTNKLAFNYTGGTNQTAPTVTLLTTDGWALLAVTQGASGSTPRYHRYLYSTDTWTHEAGGATVAGTTNTPGAGGYIRFGRWQGADAFNGDMEIAGLWDRALSDAEIELLPFSLMGWLSCVPVGLWLFDQSDIAQTVVDLTGGGATQSSITGTSVSSLSVPVFNRYGEFPTITRVPAVSALTLFPPFRLQPTTLQAM